MKGFTGICISLLLIVGSKARASLTVHDGRTVQALVFAGSQTITFIVADGRSSDGPPSVPSWSAEELVGNIETLVGGPFAPPDGHHA
jgi:hypothetical protein